jgi:hypothetical protein
MAMMMAPHCSVVFALLDAFSNLPEAYDHHTAYFCGVTL